MLVSLKQQSMFSMRWFLGRYLGSFVFVKVDPFKERYIRRLTQTNMPKPGKLFRLNPIYFRTSAMWAATAAFQPCVEGQERAVPVGGGNPCK